MGYQASYFNDVIYYPSNPNIRGKVTIYTSLEYGMPLSYTITLNDPVYNTTNNTILVSLKLVSLSKNATLSSVIPQYLSKYLAANSH